MISIQLFENISGGFVGRDLSSLSKINRSTEDFIRLKQIHSDKIFWIRKKEEVSEVHVAEGDAIISTVADIPIAVRVADCVPILIAHPSGVIAAVHAGWRGTKSNILQKTVLEIKEKLNLSLQEMRMMVGPAICANCYEVGAEVAKEFLGRGESCIRPEDVESLEERANTRFAPTLENQKITFIKELKNGKFLLDLKLANQIQAIECGVPAQQIEVRSECTLCDEKDFYSYRGSMKRGEKGEGRNYAWIVLRQ